MKPKRHYLDSYSTNVLIGLLLIPVIFSFAFLALESALHITVIMLTLLSLPFLIKNYVIVKNGKIYKYTLGGKNKSYEFSINIEDIVKIEKITKSNKVTGLSITTSYHHDPTVLRSKTASELLKEILVSNNDIAVS